MGRDLNRNQDVWALPVSGGVRTTPESPLPTYHLILFETINKLLYTMNKNKYGLAVRIQTVMGYKFIFNF